MCFLNANLRTFADLFNLEKVAHWRHDDLEFDCRTYLELKTINLNKCYPRSHFDTSNKGFCFSLYWLGVLFARESRRKIAEDNERTQRRTILTFEYLVSLSGFEFHSQIHQNFQPISCISASNESNYPL